MGLYSVMSKPVLYLEVKKKKQELLETFLKYKRFVKIKNSPSEVLKFLKKRKKSVSTRSKRLTEVKNNKCV